jgi:anti-sigma factor RsiW
MNINQHNYEEYFLLYADGELSAQDKLAVEQFVQGNPNLAEELDMFLQLKLPLEDIQFEEKSLLFKHTETIGLKNYEEYFLLYVDNELDAAGKQSVEKFVLQHPALQEQFMLLKQTRLAPEIIVCPDKRSLYKKAEKERPVFYMRWQRIAVAAAFIGLTVLGWQWFSSTETLNAPITAKREPVVPAGRDNKNGTDSKPATQPTEQMLASNVPANQPDAKIHQANNDDALAANTKTQAFAINDVTETPLNRITVEPAATVRTENPVDKETSILGGHLNEKQLIEKPLVQTTAADETVSSNAQHAIYRELDTDTEDEKKTLYLGALEINKDKLRGFFRKAGSLFRGKAKQQEEEEKTETTPSTNTRLLK